MKWCEDFHRCCVVIIATLCTTSGSERVIRRVHHVGEDKIQDMFYGEMYTVIRDPNIFIYYKKRDKN